jgi:hypothetical protein
MLARNVGRRNRLTFRIGLAARVWCLDNFGQKLLANPRGGNLYEWDPAQGGHATPVPNAPAANLGMFVTEERFCVLLGAAGDKLNTQWCAQQDIYTWTTTVTNTAGNKQLNAGNETIGGGKVRGAMSLLQTDTAAFVHQYTGDDFVFATRLAGDKCGLVGPAAAVEYAGARYWMSDANFFVFDGTVPRPLLSDDIRDYVFRDINLTQKNKFWAWVNGRYGEIWFHYCSSGASEIDRYVAVRVADMAWTIGTLARTAGVDRSIFTLPILAGSDFYLYSHETGTDDDVSAMDSYITSAPADIADGEVNMDISGIVVDFKRIVGTVNVSILTRPYPAGALTTNGPYAVTSVTENVDARADGKQAAVKIESNAIGGDYRVGRMRIDVDPQGGR